MNKESSTRNYMGAKEWHMPKDLEEVFMPNDRLATAQIGDGRVVVTLKDRVDRYFDWYSDDGSGGNVWYFIGPVGELSIYEEFTSEFEDKRATVRACGPGAWLAVEGNRLLDPHGSFEAKANRTPAANDANQPPPTRTGQSLRGTI
jgi:hypothetical protein